LDSSTADLLLHEKYHDAAKAKPWVGFLRVIGRFLTAALTTQGKPVSISQCIQYRQESIEQSVLFIRKYEIQP
jgi:hypothetical protein